jgi:capsular exopolysaccharide synthesis family protein
MKLFDWQRRNANRNRGGSGTRTDNASERLYMIGPNMNFASSEAYKLLRTNLLFSFSGISECRIIGITSSFSSEGKSLTSVNLAYTMAESKRNVLLVEGDMRLPTLNKRLVLSASPGLSNLLVGMSTAGEAVQTFRASNDEDSQVTLDVLVAGDIPPNPSELLGSERMQSLLEVLRQHYDFIILDLPPVTAVTDALVACKLVDGMVVVVRADHAVRGALAETIRQLRLVNAHILGFVFNGAQESGAGYYRRRGYYKKHYKYNYYYKKSDKK